jgi:hypothetical protein
MIRLLLWEGVRPSPLPLRAYRCKARAWRANRADTPSTSTARPR